MIAFKIIVSLLYLYAGLALLLGRRKFAAEGKPPNLMIPAALLLLAAVTTPFIH